MSTHHRIIQALKQAYEKDNNPLCMELGVDEPDDLLRRYFLNFRAGDPENPKGLRLKDTGLLVMQCYFSAHKIELPGDYRIKPLHLIYLDRKCRMPWHLKGNFITYFESEMAFRTKLVGDIDLLMHSFP